MAFSPVSVTLRGDEQLTGEQLPFADEFGAGFRLHEEDHGMSASSAAFLRGWETFFVTRRLLWRFR